MVTKADTPELVPCWHDQGTGDESRCVIDGDNCSPSSWPHTYRVWCHIGITRAKSRKGKRYFLYVPLCFRYSFPARSNRLWKIMKHALFLLERNIVSVSRYFKCNAESSARMLHLWTISGLELTIGSYGNYAGIFCLMISLHRIVPNRIEEYSFCLCN